MYNVIDTKRSARKLYTEALIGRGDITVEEAEGALRDYQEQLEKVFRETREAAERRRRDRRARHRGRAARRGHPGAADPGARRRHRGQRRGRRPGGADPAAAAGRASPSTPARTAAAAPGPDGRRTTRSTGRWARRSAIGSLLTDGISVRLAGQDSRRGTFGQRHMVIIDRKTGWAYKPLKRCYEKGAKLYVYDSPLSEFAAMGFEYGYSVARPESLVMWEAQFGDFANGAQTIIDEFLASG